jgi:hypothetical protein
MEGRSRLYGKEKMSAHLEYNDDVRSIAIESFDMSRPLMLLLVCLRDTFSSLHAGLSLGTSELWDASSSERSTF